MVKIFLMKFNKTKIRLMRKLHRVFEITNVLIIFHSHK